MKRIILPVAVCLVILLGLLLNGCASTPAEVAQQPATTVSSEQPSSAGQPVELKFFYRVSQAKMEENYKWLVNTFNERNAGKIHVSDYNVDGDTYKAKINIELKSEEPPDVFFSWEGGRAKAIIDAGWSANLDEYYSKYGWEDILVPASVKLATFDGSKYFVPTELGASIVWYLTDIYDKYNLKPPQTWDELAANAEVLKENGIAPFMLANQKQWPAQFDWSALFVNTYGVQAYDDLINRKIPWTDERVVATFDTMKKMMDDGWFYKDANSLDVTPAVIPFGKEETAMWYQGSFMIGRFRGDAGPGKFLFPLDFFTYPQIGDQTPTMEVFAEDTLMMHANSQHKDEAAEFLNFVISTEAQQQKIEIDKPYAANKNVDYSALSDLEKRLAQQMKDAGDFTFMHPDHALADQVSQPYLESLQAVLGGAMTSQQAAEKIEQAASDYQGPVQ